MTTVEHLNKGQVVLSVIERCPLFGVRGSTVYIYIMHMYVVTKKD